MRYIPSSWDHALQAIAQLGTYPPEYASGVTGLSADPFVTEPTVSPIDVIVLPRYLRPRSLRTEPHTVRTGYVVPY
eukprot:5550906-Prymnesium_polylepis.1